MSSKLKNDLFLNDFPIVEEESKQLEEIEFKNDIFDVLNIDPSNSYSGFFILWAYTITIFSFNLLYLVIFIYFTFFLIRNCIRFAYIINCDQKGLCD